MKWLFLFSVFTINSTPLDLRDGFEFHLSWRRSSHPILGQKVKKLLLVCLFGFVLFLFCFVLFVLFCLFVCFVCLFVCLFVCFVLFCFVLFVFVGCLVGCWLVAWVARLLGGRPAQFWFAELVGMCRAWRSWGLKKHTLCSLISFMRIFEPGGSWVGIPTSFIYFCLGIVHR